MSFFLTVYDKVLRLFKDTRVTVVHINPLLADGIEDGYSLPFEAPTDGNEEVLAHAHELSLAERTTQYNDARIGYDGNAIANGTLDLLGSTPNAYRLNMMVGGFVEAVRGKMLPELLRGIEIDLSTIWYSMSAIPTYENGGPCQFPMFYSPGIYGDVNALWYPKNVQNWAENTAYQLNDKVKFTAPDDNVQREVIWQCRDPDGAAADESPATHPGKWRRTSFGLVNSWNKENSTHYYNTLDAPFYTSVPWFYLKYVLEQALKALDYRIEGDFMRDPRTHELGLPNLTTLDRARNVNTDAYLRVKHEDPVYYTDYSLGPVNSWREHVLHGSVESPSPYQDSGDRWDSAENTFTPDTSGTWIFRVDVTMNRGIGPAIYFDAFVALIDGDNEVIAIQPMEVIGDIGEYGDVIRVQQEVAYTVPPDRIGEPIRIAVTQGSRVQLPSFGVVAPEALATYTVLMSAGRTWPINAEDRYISSDLTIWLQAEENSIARTDWILRPERHVPNVELLNFLLAIGDALNLELDPDTETRTLHLNYKQRVVEQPEKHLTHSDDLLLETSELDHSRRIHGIRLTWNMDLGDVEEKELENAAVFAHEGLVPVPNTSGLVAVLRNTREVLKSTLLNGNYVWQVKGNHPTSLQVGDSTHGIEVKPECQPLPMLEMTLDGERYAVPVLDKAGTSAWFNIRNEQETIYLCELMPMSSLSGEVTDVPGARSWGYGWNNSDLSRMSLAWQHTDGLLPGMGHAFWLLWAHTMVAAEPVTQRLKVSPDLLRGKTWKRILHMDGQRYLVERIPVEYGGYSEQLVAEGVYAYRLRTPHEYTPFVPALPFLCSGPGYVAFEVGTGEGESVNMSSTTGWYTIRLPDTTQLTVESDVSVSGLEPGGYCIWASTEDGTPSSERSIVYLGFGGAVTTTVLDGLVGEPIFNLTVLETTDLPSIDIPELDGLTGLDVQNNSSLVNFRLHSAGMLNSVLMSNNALDQESVDHILVTLAAGSVENGSCILNSGANSPPGTAGLAAKAVLEARGWTVEVNT